MTEKRSQKIFTREDTLVLNEPKSRVLAMFETEIKPEDFPFLAPLLKSDSHAVVFKKENGGIEFIGRKQKKEELKGMTAIYLLPSKLKLVDAKDPVHCFVVSLTNFLNCLFYTNERAHVYFVITPNKFYTLLMFAKMIVKEEFSTFFAVDRIYLTKEFDYVGDSFVTTLKNATLSFVLKLPKKICKTACAITRSKTQKPGMVKFTLKKEKETTDLSLTITVYYHTVSSSHRLITRAGVVGSFNFSNDDCEIKKLNDFEEIEKKMSVPAFQHLLSVTPKNKPFHGLILEGYLEFDHLFAFQQTKDNQMKIWIVAK